MLDREILRLALPAMGALAAEPLYVLADTAIVGRLGTAELGGVGIAVTLIVTGYALFIFLAYGTTGAVARLLGAGERQRAAAQGVQSMWLAAGIGAGLGLVGLGLAGPLVDLLGADGDVRTHALTYFRISMVGLPSLTLVLAGTGYLRGLQDTRTPLVVAVATAAGNVVLELWLVFGLGWGVAGSAWSTVVAQAAGAFAYTVVVGRDVRRLGVTIRPDRRALVALGRLSIALFVRTTALRLAIVVTTSTAARMGTDDLAAHHIVFETFNFVALTLDSVAIAAQAMVGRFLGAGDAAGARMATRRMMQWGLTGGVVIGAAILLARPVLPLVFTNDHRVATLATFLLLHLALMLPLSGVVWTLDGILIGAGDLRYLAWAMAGAAAVFLSAVLAVDWLGLGIGWLWAALGLLQVARFVALYGRWRGDAWVVTGADRVAPTA
ncbi:MAG TPA: MATE family efflux transporter [Acidimicrobiales bacterium]|nr:MATE family efflux transporter [Acidimicrobiales bacterium]